MESAASVLLVISLLLLAAAVISLLWQVIKAVAERSYAPIKLIPSVPLFLGYVVTYVVWLVIAN